jgi:hypothetical protein
LHLAEALRALSADDPHVFAIERALHDDAVALQGRLSGPCR